jgi:hypothetical protein
MLTMNMRKEISVSINKNLSNFLSFDQIETTASNRIIPCEIKKEVTVKSKNGPLSEGFDIFCDDDGFKITCEKNRHTLFRAENQWDIDAQKKKNDMNKKIRTKDIDISFINKLTFDQFGLNKKDENNMINVLSCDDTSETYTDTDTSSLETIESMRLEDSEDSEVSEISEISEESGESEESKKSKSEISIISKPFEFTSMSSFSFSINFGPNPKTAKKVEKRVEKKVEKNVEKNMEKNVKNNMKDTIEDEKEKYIRSMDAIVERIKKLPWGHTIAIDPEPQYVSLNKKKMCYVTKIVRFSTYEFRGHGSKKILRYFMNKTSNDPDHSYQKIVQILTEKSRTFLPIKNWEDFWTAYEDEPIKDRHLFELIRSDQSCKPYLDIEWYNEEKEIDRTKFIKALIIDLINIFKTRYDIVITKNDILITTSHSDKKTSFHTIIDKTVDGKTLGYETNCRGFANSAWDLWVALTEHNEMYKDVIDKSVYSTDREFRAIFSNKGSDDFRPFIPYNTNTNINTNIVKPESIIDSDPSKYLRYIITHSQNNQYHHIHTPSGQGSDQQLTVIKKKYYDQEFVPQYYTDKKINELINLIKPIHPTVTYTGRSTCGTGFRFTYANKNESCYTGNVHKSNGFYVFENEAKGIIYMKCMSSCCKGYRILKKYNFDNHIDKKLF